MNKGVGVVAVGLMAGLAATGLSVAPSQSADKIRKPNVSAGNYFSKSYRVTAPKHYGGWEHEWYTRDTWTVTRRGKPVHWRDGRKLTPGKYRMSVTVRPTRSAAPRATTVGRLRWKDLRDWQFAFTNVRYVKRTHQETRTSGGDIEFDPDYEVVGGRRFAEVYFGTCYAPDFSTWWDCWYYYDANYDQVEVPFEVVTPAPEGFEWSDDVYYFDGGEWVITPIVESIVTITDGWTAYATVSVDYPKMGIRYRGQVVQNADRLSEIQPLGRNDISGRTPLTRVRGPKRVLYWGAANFRVRARNAPEVTFGEYHAVKFGMTPQQVAGIVGSNGSRLPTRSGAYVRKYKSANGSMLVQYKYGRAVATVWITITITH